MSSSDDKKVEVECQSCGGSGLYVGFAEAKGTAVICCTCGGTGCRTITFTPFTKRTERKGIHTVCWSRGSFIGTGVGAVGHSITYEEFQNGKLPPKPKES